MPNVYLYAPSRSESALELAKNMGVPRLKRFDGFTFWEKGKRKELEYGTVVVCWGSTLPELEGVKILNSSETQFNNYEQLVALAKGGVTVPKVALHQNGTATVSDYISSGYLPRMFNGVGGSDLFTLSLSAKPDYYVQKLKLVNEYRIHSFDGKSIRAGQKVPMPGKNIYQANSGWNPATGTAHPWIRSKEGGWEVNYDFRSTQEMRAAAHKAVKTLGLTFGAVDLGVTPSGALFVLGVNKAPELKGGTLTAYLKAIKKWVESGSSSDTEE